MQPLSRRGFIVGSVVTLLTGCRSSGQSAGTSPPSAPGATTTPAPPTTVPSAATTVPAAATTATTAAPVTPGSPFTLGVASGDALSDAVILWTRLAPDPLAAGGGGGMPAAPVEVAWEVATDDTFTDLVASGTATAGPEHAHSVHVDATGLAPLTSYWFRFRTGEHTSPIGRTRTMPGPDQEVAELRLGHASCQHYEQGRYAAHRDIAAADLDALVWLGDYIYEGRAHTVGQSNAIRSHDGPEAEDLAGYRNRYALYKTDADLQAAHASTPWFVIWDDHEVENNYAGNRSEDPAVPEAAFQARRAAAYQAWWEHQPVRLPAPESADYRIYRSFRLGSLAELFLLDGRQYRSDQSCGDQVLVLEPPCPETFAPGRTMLGDAQERWLLDGLAANPTTWSIVGNQTILSDLTLNGAILNHDQWDGYPEARQRLLYGIDQASLTNVVTLTGDIHAAGVIDLVVEDENGKHPVGTELITSSISSTTNLPIGAEAILAQFPAVHYADGTKRGWVRSVITPTSWEAEYRAVDDVTRADSPITSARTFRIDPATPGAQAG